MGVAQCDQSFQVKIERNSGVGDNPGNPGPGTKLVGILKPPTPSPKPRFFPSLPESIMTKLNPGSSAEQKR
jgi:hypothetical protein